ncbi:MAG: ROK family transcriptional regulator [Victivallaceae bacterium]|jgi:predicted NBD/HSP70 family sugar kinase
MQPKKLEQMQLKNHSLIKNINRIKVLNAIRENKPIARSQIAGKTGLDKKSITNFVTELLNEGLIEEAGKKDNVSGRPFTMLEFREKYVMGIYIAPHFARGVLIDLYGRIEESHEEEYPFYSGLDKIIGAVKNIYKILSSRKQPFYGVGICMPGILDMERGIVMASVNIPALNGINFRNVFAEFIHLPLYFEEESSSIALAEKWFGIGRNYNDFVCVEVSGGIGAGIVNNRRIYKGAGQYAGEIGHVSIEPGGRKCRCGNLGCLETYASEKTILECINAGSGNPIERLCYFRQGMIPQAKYDELLAETGARLGMGLSAVVNILCPKVIILSGSVVSFFGEPLIAHIKREMKKHCLQGSYEKTEIYISKLELIDAIGAATLPLSTLFEIPEYFYV